MSEVTLEQTRPNPVALTKARLEAALLEARKDETKLKQTLEMKRLKRRLFAGKRR